MTEISLELSDDVFASSADEPETLSRAILTAAALKLYQNRRLSSGKAAQLAGLSRIEFFERLSDECHPVGEGLYNLPMLRLAFGSLPAVLPLTRLCRG